MIRNIYIPARNTVNKNFAGSKQLANTVQFKTSKSDLRDNISFKGDHYADFIKQTKHKGKSCINISSIPMGEGDFSKVYNIYGFDDYLVKVMKTEGNQVPPSQIKIDGIIPIPDEFEGRNFGQPIGMVKDNEGIYVLLRQSGIPHSTSYSVKDWLYYAFDPKVSLSHKQAQKFSKDIAQLAQFPDKSYVDFADDLKFLSDKGYKVSSLNPANLLIDYEKKSINPIDIFDNKNIFKITEKNTSYDMIFPLLDVILFQEYFDLLNPKERHALIKNSKTIMNKCQTAAKKVGLSTEIELRRKSLANLDNHNELTSNNLPKRSLLERFDSIIKFINNNK